MKQSYFKILAVIMALFLLLSFNITVLAETPYESYTYWSQVSDSNKPVYNRPMYDVYKTFSAADLGVSEFSKIQSVCSDNKGNLYILDASSRIIVLDYNFKLLKEIGAISGSEYYNNAASLYVYDDSSIYICDKEGGRVIHATENGELIEFITLPDSPLIPDDFAFNPVRVTMDANGYLYVLSEGSYYGALLYSPEKSFLSFYGANTVKGSIAGIITNIQNRLFPNNEKKANTAQKLPYSFVDITMDKNGFVYTCNGYTAANDRKGQIRKLSPGTGSNILGSEEVNFVDEEINTVYNSGSAAKQNIFDIEVDSNGFVYALESVHGKVFLYDNDCNILTVFGGGMGSGTQSGNFISANGLALLNDGTQVAISDSESSLITVFNITEFGSNIKKLITLTYDGDYELTIDGWKEMLSKDSNFQPAYAGLARAYLNAEDYKMALEYAKKGYDRDTYAVAFEYHRKEFLDNNFIILFLGAVFIVVAAIAWLVISNKKKIVLIKNKQVRLMLSSPFHPSDCFTQVKEKGAGSLWLSILLVVLYYVSTVLQTLAGGFLFTKYDPLSFNSLFILVRSAGLVVLWVVSNWLVCTLLGGKGKLREIIIVTCYSLIPIIVEKFIRLILTNVLIPREAEFLGILDVIAIIYFGLILIIGLLKIHDFSMSRLVGTSILSVVGIGAIVFLIIMLIILLQQFWGFIVTVFSEFASL